MGKKKEDGKERGRGRSEMIRKWNYLGRRGRWGKGVDEEGCGRRKALNEAVSMRFQRIIRTLRCVPKLSLGKGSEVNSNDDNCFNRGVDR